MSRSTTKAEKYILFNEEDDDLKTIKVKLPPMPNYKKVDGYDLPVDKQKFRRVKIPPRLLKLERESESVDEIWEKLDYYRDVYKEEIEFIKREWDRRIHGYWFYNHGVPTYIDGWHYFYLNYWKIDVGYPDYRSRDRKFFIFARFTYTTTEAYYPYRVVDLKAKKVVRYFSKKKSLDIFLKEQNSASLKAEEGDFLIDMGRRTCLGFNYPKHRREGATYKADCILFQIISTHYNYHGGIQSMDGSSASKAFQKAVVRPWKKVPFFFSPRFVGSTDPKKKIEFDLPGLRISTHRSSVAVIDTGLESFIDFGESASRGWYDGDKLHFLHNDECGKTILEDVKARHEVQEKCLRQGINIHGLEINTSTVGEMEEKGGAAFFRLCKLSNYEERDNIGETGSGLFNLFIPAYDGLEGYIDEFGNSIIEDPTEEQAKYWKNPKRDSSGKLMGAKRYLEEKLNEILMRNDPDSLTEYEEEVRLHPTSFSQCFITRGSGSGLDIKKILLRINELRFNREITKRGDFIWQDGIPDSKVVWVDDPVSGKFVISLQLPENLTNKFVVFEYVDREGKAKVAKKPLWPWKYTASADPFKFRKTVGRRISKGGGAVFYERDKTIDPDGKPFPWETYRFVCTYEHRPNDPDIYAEDMLKMCVYYGAMMFPEVNVPIIWDHFMRRGYDGYLKYQREPNGKWKNIPGFYNRGAYPQKMMQLAQNYVANFIANERHIEILHEYRTLKGVEDITNHDLFTAVTGALVGSETSYEDFGGEEEVDYDISGYF